jgi:ribA/ribD-fused uncharacterized protein
MDGKTYPTSEHFFQAMKFQGTQHEEAVRQCATPGKAAKMGRDRSLPLRPDWETVKDEIMYTVCLAKFTQHKNIQKSLLDTGDKRLIENTRNDRYWGDAGNGTGKNQLGITLMAVRETIINPLMRIPCLQSIVNKPFTPFGEATGFVDYLP